MLVVSDPPIMRFMRIFFIPNPLDLIVGFFKTGPGGASRAVAIQGRRATITRSKRVSRIMILFERGSVVLVRKGEDPGEKHHKLKRYVF